MSAPVGFSRSARRWIVELSEGNTLRTVLFDGRSFDRFVLSAERLPVDDIERAVEVCAEAARDGIEGATRLMTFLYLFLVERTSERWRLSASRRGRYDAALRVVCAAASEIPSNDPPETNWLLGYRKGEEPGRLWDALEHRMTRSRADVGHEEVHVLAAWLAARRLLELAVVQRDAPRLLRALTHYKHWISGPQSDLVTKGPLRKVIEQDILGISRQFPQFLEAERAEREFLENWFLARFSFRDPLRFSFRDGAPFIVGAIGLLAVLAGTMIAVDVRYAFLHRVPWHVWVVCFVSVLAVFACYPRLFRLFYPRLFAGALLGWSTLLGTVATQVMLQPPQPPVQVVAQSESAREEEVSGSQSDAAAVSEFSHYMPRHLPMIPTVTTFIVLGMVLWFFLYHEVFSTIGHKLEAAWRALTLLLWAFGLVAVVGLAAHVVLERLMFHSPAPTLNRMALFAGGCAISLYVAVVAQLVWADRGVSATLGGGSDTAMFGGR